MAKVIITLEDTAKEGEDGIILDIDFTEEVDLDNPTIAEQYGALIVEMITQNAGRVDYIDETGAAKPQLTLVKPTDDEGVH